MVTGKAHGTKNVPWLPAKRKTVVNLLFRDPEERRVAIMGHNEKTSYMMLFCALLLVKKSQMKLQDLGLLFPFTGQAQFLAQRLASLDGAETLPGKGKG